MQIPRLVIAGTNSGVGKTTIATGIMGALKRKGFNVQGYKVGPDYIDPSYHTLITGKTSRNLDTWMLEPQIVAELFQNSAGKANFSVIEGVMGLFDGFRGNQKQGSTASVAKLLKAPVLLIIDVKAMAGSAAAIAFGFSKLDPELNVAGIILNRVGSEKHYQMVAEAIKEYVDIPIVGFLSKNQLLSLPERHLGLVPTNEDKSLKATLDAIVDSIEVSLDIEKIIKIATFYSDWQVLEKTDLKYNEAEIKIAYAFDEAFNFYYQDSLDLLRELGAELVTFSPLKDKNLPEDISGLIIGGGFPEIFLSQLKDNQNIKEEIKSVAEKGMPIYAECGGLMYLCQEITNKDGGSFPMVGLIPATIQMENKLVGMGYRNAMILKDSILGPQGTILKGHEFHYSRLYAGEEFSWGFQLEKDGSLLSSDGYCNKNILASYLHLHFASNKSCAKNFINNCKRFNNKMN